MKSYNITYGFVEVECEIILSERKTLNITVNPDFSVLVKAPKTASEKQIKERINKKARWIAKQVRFFESFLPHTPPRNYISGETHLYLGKQFRLKLIESNFQKVKLIRGYIEVHVKDKNNTHQIKGLMANWYREHAQRQINKRFELCKSNFITHNIAQPTIKLQRMKNRWGSCTSTGHITINPEIIKAPIRCIDYVLNHELCHLIVPNHNNEFYGILGTVMPDYPKWKDKLEKVLS